MQAESTKLRCKKGLSTLKGMSAKSIEQYHLFLLHQSVILSVTDYGLGLTALPQSNLLKLDRVQPWKSFWEQKKDTPIEAMHYLVDLPSREQGIRWGKSNRISMRCRIPKIHSTMLSKR